jgi:hypothetical protein
MHVVYFTPGSGAALTFCVALQYQNKMHVVSLDPIKHFITFRQPRGTLAISHSILTFLPSH